MSKTILSCDYCGNIIDIKDTKCPNCGANCSSVIKKYQEEVNSEEERLRKENMARVRKIQKMSTTSVFFIVLSIFIIVVAFIFVFVFIIFKEVKSSDTKTNKDSTFEELRVNNKKEIVDTTFNKTAKGSRYDLIIDKYEAFEYKNSMGLSMFNTPDGYQKVAFHFVITNTSGGEIDILDPFFIIDLKADGVVVEDCGLESSPGYNVSQGKGSYEKLKGAHLFDGDMLQGYVGYVVPKKAKKLLFTIDKEIRVEMNNPYYVESD